MRDSVKKYDVHRWGRIFLHALTERSAVQRATVDKLLTEDKMEILARQFGLARRRALFF